VILLSLIRIRIVRGGRKVIGLVLPLFPFLALLIVLVLALSPFLIVLVFLSLFFRGSRNFLYMLGYFWILICSLRGLFIDVRDGGNHFLLEIR